MVLVHLDNSFSCFCFLISPWVYLRTPWLHYKIKHNHRILSQESIFLSSTFDDYVKRHFPTPPFNLTLIQIAKIHRCWALAVKHLICPPTKNFPGNIQPMQQFTSLLLCITATHSHSMITKPERNPETYLDYLIAPTVNYLPQFSPFKYFKLLILL